MSNEEVGLMPLPLKGKPKRVCSRCGCQWVSKGGKQAGCPRCHKPMEEIEAEWTEAEREQESMYQAARAEIH